MITFSHSAPLVLLLLGIGLSGMRVWCLAAVSLVIAAAVPVLAFVTDIGAVAAVTRATCFICMIQGGYVLGIVGQSVVWANRGGMRDGRRKVAEFAERATVDHEIVAQEYLSHLGQ